MRLAYNAFLSRNCNRLIGSQLQLLTGERSFGDSSFGGAIPAMGHNGAETSPRRGGNVRVEVFRQPGKASKKIRDSQGTMAQADCGPKTFAADC